MAFDLLPTLRPRQWHYNVCVRVCRKWQYRGGTDSGPIQHVDLVLVDEKGNSMYAEIPGPQVETKSPLIEEDGIYVIKRFRVSNAKSAYRPVACPYMIEFTLHTTVQAARMDMPDFPKYAYRLTAISDLSARAGDTRDFIDTIGVLVETSDAYMVRLPNKPAATMTRHIVLRDLSYSEMKVTLWGERAAAFNIDGVDGVSENKPIVVLFVGGLMKSYQGTYYVSGNTASRWYFNPDIPEARQFYDSYLNQTIQIRAIATPTNQDGEIEAPPTPEDRTLHELNAMDPYEFPANGYRCSVTIGRLVPDVSWWFPSCSRCSRACAVDGSGYRCNACGTNAYRFKYKVSFVAVDGTNEAEMICFGDVARRMIGKSVQQVLRTAANPNSYPADITRLVSLRFTFHIALTQQSYYRQAKSYQVLSVVTSHGQQNVDPHPNGPTTPGSNQSLPSMSDTQTELTSSDSLTDVTTPTFSKNTTPSSVTINKASETDKIASDSLAKGSRSSARKRLPFTSNEEPDANKLEQDLHKKELVSTSLQEASVEASDKSVVAVKGKETVNKRSRGTAALAQKSG